MTIPRRLRSFFGFWYAVAQVIGRTLGYLSPLIFFRLVYPLSPYSAGAIDAVIISVIVGVLILAFAFTFNSLYNRFFRW